MTASAPEDSFYDIHLFCCVNSRAPGHPRGDCASRNALDLQGYLKMRVKGLPETGRIRINQSGCLDRCELGPVMVIYPQGIWYHYRNQADMDEILERHILDGALVERLLLKNDATSPPAG
ncbi:MAG: (2Fe-2S) ferredoxin domain-containing protein [Magnetococcales bacterium]|nr:(2Fe-2S) ferredoxin domain-containing protein [Magnetococcales bacterium]